jgi:hypothetical protein
MITENTKKIFSNAAKATEKFAREAISVFPKFEVAKLNIAEKLVYKNLKAMEESDVLDEAGKKKLKKLEQKKKEE